MSSLLPQPRFLEPSRSGATLTSPLFVAAPTFLAEEVATFANDMADTVGWAVERIDDAEGADIRILIDEAMHPEGFSVRVDGVIDLVVGSPTGLAYAFSALRQMGPAELFGVGHHLDEWELEGLNFYDEPAYAWRGCHLDVSRHFFDVATVCRHIDLIAMHRLNRLHLHLNDDQGWRVEIPNWPRLTTVGAYRSGSPIGHENDDVRDEVPHGGFFTADDIALLRAHAAKRHVQLMPEIDLPGHAQAVLAAYPQFGNTTEPLDVWTHWGISHHVLNVEPATLAFAEEVVCYVASLFPGSPVHIGGDECPSDEWAQSEAARAVMEANGFTSPGQLQGLYTSRLAAALMARGHEVVAWDEVLDADVLDGTIIAAWRSAEKGIEAASRGLDVIMAPEQVLYLDVLNSDDPSEPVAISPLPRVTTWQDVYRVTITPSSLDPTLHHHIRGAQVQLWTEYIATRDHLDYMAFPRLCAFAEVVWGSATSVEAFRPRLTQHLERLRAFGVAYRPLD